MTTRSMLIELTDARTFRNVEVQLRDDGWTVLESFTPTAPNDREDTAPALYPRSIAIAALLWGLIAGIACYAMEYYSAVFDYAIDVGGRPTNSAAAFMPAALEMTMLGAAVGAVIAFLFAAHLPRFHHPLFDVEEFSRVTDDRYFLLIDSRGERLDEFHERMQSMGALAVHKVRDAD